MLHSYLAMWSAPVLSVIRTSRGALPKLLACQVAPKPLVMGIQVLLPCTRQTSASIRGPTPGKAWP